MPQGLDSKQNYYSFINNNTTPLVFVHGVGLSHQMWKPQINSLKEHSTITYDLLGHGKTPFNKEKVTLNDFSNQLLSLLEFLKIDKCNLIGFSLGSLIALDFASNFQDRLNSLTVIGTTYKRTENATIVVRIEEKTEGKTSIVPSSAACFAVFPLSKWE